METYTITMNNNPKLFKILSFIFYSTFFAIVLLCVIEMITYPGLFQNKLKINLNLLIIWLSIINLPIYFKLQSFKPFKLSKNIYKFSIATIFFTLCLSTVELLTYPNFVFSKLYINHYALQILSYFLFIFLATNFLPKFNHIKLPKVKYKHNLIVILCLLFIPIITYFSWSQHLSNNHIAVSETKFLSFTDNLINSQSSPKQESLKNQFTWFFKPIDDYGKIKIFFNLFEISFGKIFLIISLMFCINWWQSDHRSKDGILLTVFFLSGLAYTVLMILICVVMFSPGELKVFQGRYLLTFILALYTFSFYLFIDPSKRRKINFLHIIYLTILILTLNPANLSYLKPIPKEELTTRQKEEQSFQWIKDYFNQKKIKTTIHTIGGIGPVGYRYFLAPYQVITPIWQDWDVFMFTNPEFKHSTYVFVSSANDILAKWSPQIEKIFRDKKYIKDNSLYQVTRLNDTSFELQLINPNE